MTYLAANAHSDCHRGLAGAAQVSTHTCGGGGEVRTEGHSARRERCGGPLEEGLRCGTRYCRIAAIGAPAAPAAQGHMRPGCSFSLRSCCPIHSPTRLQNHVSLSLPLPRRRRDSDASTDRRQERRYMLACRDSPPPTPHPPTPTPTPPTPTHPGPVNDPPHPAIPPTI
jgi:hypothetical protein